MTYSIPVVSILLCGIILKSESRISLQASSGKKSFTLMVEWEKSEKWLEFHFSGKKRENVEG